MKVISISFNLKERRVDSMNLGSLFSWITGVVLMLALTGNLDPFHNWVIRSQAMLVYESRASNWGSPRFLK